MKQLKLKAALLIILIIIALTPYAIADDPGIPDTVYVDSVTAFPTGQAILPIFFTNDELLSAVQVVLRHNDNYLSIDSFSIVGGRLDGFPDLTINTNDSADVVSFAAMETFQATEDIPIGSGLLCNLFLTVDIGAAGMTIPIDTVTWLLAGSGRKSTIFSDANAVTIKPQFEKGYITVLDAPPTNDTVWVDSVGATAGNQVAMGIYGSNQEDLAAIDLSLSYSSGFLTYKSVIFDQSRSEASQKVIEANQSLRHIHIGLDFGEENPLPPGRGLLATVLFDVSAAAIDELAIIDSTSYLTPEGQSLEFHQATEAGGASFAPYFKAGHIDIKSATTDVNDDDPLNLPKSYSLAQNTPNPFNPSTIIEFDLPKVGHVQLTVFNILGQTVRKLYDQKLPAGSHSVVFNGKDDNDRDVASGIYFYRLEADDFSQTRKMMLLK